MTRLRVTGGLVLLAAGLAACGGSSGSGGAPASVSPGAPSAAASSTAGGGCGWLSAADFAAVGITGAGAPTDNPSEPGSHYCVYAGVSGATGGIELDTFVSPDMDASKETYRTAVGEGPAGRPPAGLDVDEATFAIDGKVAYLTAREGRLVLALAAPASADAEADLATLARLVVERAAVSATP